MTDTQLLERLNDGALDETLTRLYCREGEDLTPDRRRLAETVQKYARLYPEPTRSAALFSGPGRTEIGGNHTDHQHGCVLAGAVNLDMLAAAAPNGSKVARLKSEGYPAMTVDLSDLAPRGREEGTSAALVRGVAAFMAAEGHPVGGFNAYITSNVPAGSGLSSSAAYEVLIGVILNHFFCGDAFSAVRIAQIGQKAENQYFGKPCGLMDQTASSVGGAVAIDFADPAAPVVEKVDFDFTASGHALCIIDSGADHTDLTDEYAAITREMFGVAGLFGKKALREVDEGEFISRLPEIRTELGDRAALRAMHFFGENRRARQEADALVRGDFEGFLSLVRQSGLSSALRLQNVSVAADYRRQAVGLAIARAEDLLAGSGAVRVHGGGFAGTLQAFVPNGRLAGFKAGMEALLGENRCHILSIRPTGGCVIAD